MRSTAAVILSRYCNGTLHVCVVWTSSLQIEMFLRPAALRPVSTTEMVIAQVIDHFDGNTLSRVNERKYWFSGDIGYCCSTMRPTAAVNIFGYRNGKLHVCVVWISSTIGWGVSVVFPYWWPAALRYLARFLVFPGLPWHFYFMRGHSLFELTEHDDSAADIMVHSMYTCMYCCIHST